MPRETAGTNLVEVQQSNETMRSLLGDILHQLRTDSDLENITGAMKYEKFAERIEEVLRIDFLRPA